MLREFGWRFYGLSVGFCYEIQNVKFKLFLCVSSHFLPVTSSNDSMTNLNIKVRSRGVQPTRLLCPWKSPGKNTGVGRHSLLQRIFPTQGLNSCLLHWQVNSLHQAIRKAHFKVQLKKKKSTSEGIFIHRFYTNTKPFYIRDLGIFGFLYLWGSWNQSPVDTKGKLYFLTQSMRS